MRASLTSIVKGVLHVCDCMAGTDSGGDVLDVLLVFLAAFLGAAAGLLTGWLTRRREAVLKEEAAVNNLLLDLAAKRAFAIDASVAWAPGAAGRILDSVNHTRTLIRSARVELRPRSKFLEPLRMMMLACNTFIEQAEYREGGPSVQDLDRLTKEIRAEARRIRKVRPTKIVTDEPGTLAVSRRVDR